MTPERCHRCLQFTSPLRPHDCPCDAFRRRQARHHAATALVLLAAALGLLYVANVPEPALEAASQLPRATETAAGAVAATGSRSADPAASGAVVDSAGALPTEADEPAETVGVPPPSMPAPDTATILAGGTTRQGTLSYVGKRFGRLYLALPDPRGTVARICGPGGCVTRTSTDYGPDQRVNPDRVADLSAWDWETVCAVPLALGLCSGTVTILERPVIRLPETDR